MFSKDRFITAVDLGHGSDPSAARHKPSKPHEEGMATVRALFAVVALMATCAWTAGASAAPQQLDCVLTDTDGRPHSENRAISIVFDQDKKTLTAEEDGKDYRFERVSISNVSINGSTENVTVGIDRSSLGIVWQRYDPGAVRTEFGHCQRTRSPM